MSFKNGIIFSVAEEFRRKNRYDTGSERLQSSRETAKLYRSLTKTILSIFSYYPKNWFDLTDIQWRTNCKIEDREMKHILNSLVEYELLEKEVQEQPFIPSITYYRYAEDHKRWGWLSTIAFGATATVAYCVYADYILENFKSVNDRVNLLLFAPMLIHVTLIELI